MRSPPVTVCSSLAMAASRRPLARFSSRSVPAEATRVSSCSIARCCNGFTRRCRSLAATSHPVRPPRPHAHARAHAHAHAHVHARTRARTRTRTRTYTHAHTHTHTHAHARAQLPRVEEEEERRLRRVPESNYTPAVASLSPAEGHDCPNWAVRLLPGDCCALLRRRTLPYAGHGSSALARAALPLRTTSLSLRIQGNPLSNAHSRATAATARPAAARRQLAYLDCGPRDTPAAELVSRGATPRVS